MAHHSLKFWTLNVLTLSAVTLFSTFAAAQEAATAPVKKTAAKTAGAAPFISTPDKIKWTQLSPGVELGPVYGQCDKVGAPCVFQLKFQAGAKLPPHWHPVDENVSVLSGTFMAGMGDTYDETKMMTLPSGTYVFMPRKMHHFAGAKDVTVVQVHGVGPFKMTFVNPADEPGNAAKPKSK